MSLKQLLVALFLLTASLSHSDNDKNLNVTEQAAPVEQKQDVAAPPSAIAPKQTSEDKTSGQNLSPLPSSTEMTTSYESAFVRMLITLLGLVFLVFATFWILRKLGKGKFKMGSGRMINVVEKRALSPKSMLYIVEIENKRVLICESQLKVRALTSYETVSDVND
jgi:flagellar biogenesis protein FliO